MTWVKATPSTAGAVSKINRSAFSRLSGERRLSGDSCQLLQYEQSALQCLVRRMCRVKGLICKVHLRIRLG